MNAYFNHNFSISLTKDDAFYGSQNGQCESYIQDLLNDPKISKRLDKLNSDDIRAELKDAGAWDAEELADDEANRARILWIACCNIRENIQEKQRHGGK